MDKEIHYHQVVDISVAVAIDDGLVTPVVRDADRKGVAADRRRGPASSPRKARGQRSWATRKK